METIYDLPGLTFTLKGGLEDDQNKQDEALQSKNDEELYDVVHSMIDFRYLIFAQKLQSYKKDCANHEPYKFDDLELANLINTIQDNPTIFNQVTIRRIIDH